MEREKLAERIEFLTEGSHLVWNESKQAMVMKQAEKDNDPTGELQEAFCN